MQLFATVLYQLSLLMKFTLPFLFVALVLIPPSVGFADENLFKRENEIIYGRKHGMTMTIDVFQPLAKRLNWVGLLSSGDTRCSLWFTGANPNSLFRISGKTCTHVDHSRRCRQTGADPAGALDHAQVQGSRRRGGTARHARKGSRLEG